MAVRAPVSIPPALIRLIRQTGLSSDCGIATLASLCGVGYDEALIACASVVPAVLDAGMSWREIRAAARKLGVPTKILRAGQYGEDSTGILCVSRPGDRLDHFTFLWADRVLEGNGELWLDLESYCHAYGYVPGSLLIRTDLEHQASPAVDRLRRG